MANVGHDGSDGLVSLISLGVLLFTSTLLFVAWKEVVDLLWGVPRHRGVKASLRRRLFGLAAVLGSGLLLTLVLVVEAMVAAFSRISSSSAIDVLITVTSSFVPALLGVLFIGVLFKYTPDEDIAWRSVWLAAAMSMALMVLGAWGYGFYLDSFGLGSAAGVAGSLLLGLALIYYGVTILLYGVEIVKGTHAHRSANEARMA